MKRQLLNRSSPTIHTLSHIWALWPLMKFLRLEVTASVTSSSLSTSLWVSVLYGSCCLLKLYLAACLSIYLSIYPFIFSFTHLGTLKEHLSKRTLTWNSFCSLSQCLSSALAYLHSAVSTKGWLGRYLDE